MRHAMADGAELLYWLDIGGSRRGRRSVDRATRSAAHAAPIELASACPARLATVPAAARVQRTAGRRRGIGALASDPRSCSCSTSRSAMGAADRVRAARRHDAHSNTCSLRYPADAHATSFYLSVRSRRSLTSRAGCAYHPRRSKRDLRKRPAVRELAGAEGATAPEPLRQTDRRLMALWKAAGSQRRLTEGVRRASPPKSLRSRDRGGLNSRSPGAGCKPCGTWDR